MRAVRDWFGSGEPTIFSMLLEHLWPDRDFVSTLLLDVIQLDVTHVRCTFGRHLATRLPFRKILLPCRSLDYCHVRLASLVDVGRRDLVLPPLEKQKILSRHRSFHLGRKPLTKACPTLRVLGTTIVRRLRF